MPHDADYFRAHRERFLAVMEPDSAALFLAAPEQPRSADGLYPYRQDSDFLYLTGFDEPQAAALFLPEHAQHTFLLFVLPRDPQREVWTGRRAGVEGAREVYGADDAFEIDDLGEKLTELLADHRTLYYAFGRVEEHDRRVARCMQCLRRKSRQGVTAPSRWVDPGEILHEMRRIKDAADIARIRMAVAATAPGFAAARAAIRPGMHEYELQAILEKEFLMHGAVHVAFNTIVAGGDNANILHYEANRDVLRDGDLVLIDAGAEKDLYTADVTRTLPVNGTFTAEQRRVHDLVLAAQEAALLACRPGNTFADVHDAAVRVLTKGLVDLGFIQGPVDEAISEERYKEYYPHNTSHWLGMDVHDAGTYGSHEHPCLLVPGMVFSVEPGLYLPAGDEDLPADFRGIGVRIEDDVLITAGGHEVLTREIPK